MAFQKEADFERALIQVLMTKGWEDAVLQHPTEQDLIQNWAKILFDNNRGIDRLGDYPLTESEMQQILEQITQLRTPLKLNGFINGKTVSIKRDNPDDKAHYVSYVGNPKLMNNVMADIVIQIPTQAEERDKLSSFFASLDNLITLHQRKSPH